MFHGIFSRVLPSSPDDAAEHALPSTAYLTGSAFARVDAVQETWRWPGAAPALARRPARHCRKGGCALPKSAALPCRALPSSKTATSPPSAPPLPFCRGATARWRTASWAATTCPRGRAFASLDVYGRRRRRPPGLGLWRLGLTDKAKHLATLYLNDLADVLRDAVDERFEFVRYAESLAGSQPTFDPLANALAAPPTLVDELLEQLTHEAIPSTSPPWCCCRCPSRARCMRRFALRQAIKAQHPHITTVLGGGFVNTELRELAEPRVFDHFDLRDADAANARCWRCWNTCAANAAASGWCAPCAR